MDQRNAFSPPLERSHRGWRGIFGASSGGSRTPGAVRRQRSPPYPTSQFPSTQYQPPGAQSTQTHSPKSRPTSSLTRGKLIVGVDFGTFDSSVAFAFATETASKEDIINEWPGASGRIVPRVYF